MIFPFRDDQPRSTTAYVNYFIIAANVAVFGYEFWLALHDRMAWYDFYKQYAEVPHHFELAFSGSSQYTISAAFLTIFTSMFMHSGWLHLIGNMWALWIFGDNIEDHFGHIVYPIFYLVCGLLASMAYIYSDPVSDIPAVGASGAIAGVMGAFLLRYPQAQVQLFVLLGFRAGAYWVPAWIVLAVWFALQLFGQIMTRALLGTEHGGGVAYWAHLGGFVTGMALIKLIPGYTQYKHGGWFTRDGKEIRPKGT
jgi:membrane associated rhomboid family serine protease